MGAVAGVIALTWMFFGTYLVRVGVTEHDMHVRIRHNFAPLHMGLGGNIAAEAAGLADACVNGAQCLDAGRLKDGEGRGRQARLTRTLGEQGLHDGNYKGMARGRDL
ncbi:hypothetical protein CENSYa_0894 [Cenarchaeum symbiosum A]|uniref:Uncharacterized protein n=1 Tax=Cenarchaeum symbiosum (strain A) TaxID=414004 RepID=A0RW09_CENSY|nr:hypothetical protein CENSYa_0894 [Cenarchaeum symbiosum A]